MSKTEASPTFEDQIELCEEMKNTYENLRGFIRSSRAKDLLNVYGSTSDHDIRQNIASDLFKEFTVHMER